MPVKGLPLTAELQRSVSALPKKSIDQLDATNRGEGVATPIPIELYLERAIDRELRSIEAAAIAKARARRSKQLWIALSDLVVAIVLAFATMEPGLLSLLFGLLFVEWIWLTVIVVRASNAIDDAKKTTRAWAAELLQLGIAEALAYAEAEAEVAERELLEYRITRGTPPPDPQPYGVSHEGAEAIVAVWMQHLGAGDAKVTRYSGDGGIDVESTAYIAQVKNYMGTVGVVEVRELAGVALVDGRTPLFFTSGYFAEGASAFADRAGIALFKYDAAAGNLIGANAIGDALRVSGL